MVINVFFSAVTQATMSRHELLAWVNDCLQSNLTKIEEMSTGAAYCGLTDFLFPGSVPVKKVKWNCKSEPDQLNNWHILQKAWKDLGIDKPIPIDRLLRGKFQENFEFLQWFKKFFDANWADHEYDAIDARGGEDFPAALPGGTKAPARVSAPRPPPPRAAPKAAATTTKPALPPKAGPPARTTQAKPSSTSPAPPTNGAAAGGAAEAKFKQKVDELTNENAVLGETVAALEKERDFYFNKLRAVEILCTEIGEGKTVTTDKVLQILYETDDQEGVQEQVQDEATHVEAGIQDIEVPEIMHKEIEEIKNELTHDVKENGTNGATEAIVHQAAAVNLDDSETF
ncbi:hypothetical protein FO519_004702 [Halicephalobus sp. NKZ332]|nr:hypothetical protein FO519_004702 [Halicephalobus sp. NKZ332]